MKKLLIVESPAKIKTIAKFLGKNFKIMSTVGHIKDLPQKELGIDINKTITIDYVILEGKNKTIADICKEAQHADEIFLGPDPDREGEIIAWHIEQEIAKVVKNPDKIHRITFNEITKPAIEEALAHPTHIDLNKVAAQQARRVLDRLVGYEVSPILWRKVAKGLSAGRVQSVALKLICLREESIRAFKQEEYWSINGLFSTLKNSFTAILTTVNKKKPSIAHKEKADELVKNAKKQSYIVDAIKDSKRLKSPSAPFMTSTLQQSAYNQLGFAVQRTMQIAQGLYEGIPLEDTSTPVALITYMRTDSLRISEIALKQARTYIAKVFGKDYLPTQANIYSKTKGQDAHEAIRPIDVTITPEYAARYLPSEAAKLYALIWKRFVASQLKPAQYAQRQVTISGGPFVFKVTGSTLLFDGFLKVYNDESESEKEVDMVSKDSLPDDLKTDMSLELKELLPKQHFTQPPTRYTEASLVKDLEKEGIGRPSTYATILKTIQARSYTTLDPKKRFVPTELGMVVTTMLTQNLPKIMNLSFTATMEQDLDKIASGNLKRDVLLKDFYTDFEKDLEAFRGEAVKRPAEKTEIICPKCQEQNLVIKFGKAGSFLGCPSYPECTFTSNFQRTDSGIVELLTPEEPKLLKELCPSCQKPLRQLQGKYGPFVACSGYPQCKYIQPITANFKCLSCQTGDVIQRIWKKNKFWGCSTYPECTFSIPGEIEQIPCPQCQAPFLLKRFDKMGNISLNCATKECNFKKQVEPTQ